MIPINYLAVVVSTIVMFVLGGLWYGPIFGKQWIALMGFSSGQMPQTQAAGMKGVWKSYALMAVGAFLMSFTLAHNLIFGSAYLGITGVSAGLQAGFWNWLGFVAPTTVGMVLWEGKPWRLWMIVAGYYLVGMLIAGVMLAVWM